MGKQETGAGPGSARGENSSVGPAAPTNLGVDPPDADQARNRSDVLSSRNRPAGPGSKTRRAVRLHQNGGGGGHRTHVRKPSATGIYIHSRLSFALATPPSNRLVVRAASS